MEKKNIIVVGAGFGGMTAALSLEKLIAKEKLESLHNLLLLDRNRHHLYTPSLYELAALPRECADDAPMASCLSFPIETIMKRRAISFVCDELIGADLRAQTIRLKGKGDIPYEYLILAPGSETNFFSIPGLEQYCIPLKTAQNAVFLRNTIEAKLKEKERVTIVIGGAGPSGIELAAEAANFARTMKEIQPLNFRNPRIILVEAGSDILPGFLPDIIQRARLRLGRLGIEIKTNMPIESVDAASVFLKNAGSEPYDILVWTGGVKGPSVLQTLGIPLTPKGSIVVNEYLEAKEAPGVFAVGDAAGFVDPKTQRLLAWSIPVAEAEARNVAKNIVARIQGKEKVPFRPSPKYPFVLALGKKYAVGDFVFFTLDGFLGWISKIAIELKYLLFLFPAPTALKMWWTNVRLYGKND